MAMRDAGDFGFGMEFPAAVKKGRVEGWSDRDIAVLLKCSEADVAAIPKEKIPMRLEDLKFRDDEREGGKVIEYLVDGRVKTQTVAKLVGEVLEALVNSHLEWVEDYKGVVHQYGDLIIELREKMREIENERLRVTDSGDGDKGKAKRGRPAKRAKEKVNAET